MKHVNLALFTFAIACGEAKEVTAEPEANDTADEVTDTADSETEDTGAEDTDTEDTAEEDTSTNDTGTEDTGVDDTGTEDTGTDDTGSEDTGTDPLADAVCSPSFAGCSDQDFAANDFTGSAGPITINMIGMQPYDPKCLTIRVGQTVRVGAAGNHPFQIACAEDSIMDSQNNSTSQVEFTFETPGYYNYRCGVPSHVNMVGNIKVLPE